MSVRGPGVYSVVILPPRVSVDTVVPPPSPVPDRRRLRRDSDAWIRRYERSERVTIPAKPGGSE